MVSLQQILLGREWVSRDTLRAALRHQKQVGGELAICLLEVGAIPEDRLLRALSERYGVPYAEVEALRETPSDVAALLSKRLACRARAIPFHHAGTALHVAMADPLDLAAQDEIAFACGKRLHVHVSHEARIAEALDRFYGEEPASRLAALIDKLNRNRFLWRESGPVVAPTGVGGEAPEPGGLWGGGAPLDPPDLPDPVAELFPESAGAERGHRSRAPTPATPPVPATPPAPEPESPPRPAASPTKAPQRAIQLSPEERRKLYGGISKQRPDTPPGAVSDDLPADPFEAAAQRLETARDRDEVGSILLDLLASQFQRSLLFVVRRDRVEGWRGRGGEVDPAKLRQLSLSLERPSIFLNLLQGTPFHLGALADFPAHRQLAEVWGGGLPGGCLVVPVRLHDRVVLTLYGDRGEEEIGGIPLHRFQDLASRTAAALKRCIALKKQRTSGAGRG